MPKQNGELTRAERRELNKQIHREGAQLSLDARRARALESIAPLPVRAPYKKKYTTEMGELICQRISNGEMLTTICREEAMPPYNTVMDWQSDNEEFRKMYVKARARSAHVLAEHAHRITAAAVGGDVDSDVARVATHNLSWLAGKMDDQYADKKAGNGADANLPPVLNLTLNRANK
jgi:hypothetical protein